MISHEGGTRCNYVTHEVVYCAVPLDLHARSWPCATRSMCCACELTVCSHIKCSKQTNWDDDSTRRHALIQPLATTGCNTLSFVFSPLCFCQKATDKTRLSRALAPDLWHQDSSGNFFPFAAQTCFLWRKHPDNEVLTRKKSYFPRQSAFPCSAVGLFD